MQNGIRLKKNVNLSLLIFYGLGNTLGAGIYVLVGKVAGIAGLFAPIAFVVSSLVVIFTALTYAELSARYPLSAGEAVYIHRGLGLKWLAVFVGLLICTAGIVSAATICQGFIGYFQVFIDIPERLALVILILTLGCIAAWGIKEAVTTAAVLTVIEIIGLLLIIVTGLDNITLDRLRETELFPAWDVPVWLSILNGAFLAVYAFLGFEDMVNVAEEVKNPERNMPLGIILTLLISTALYFMVSFVAVIAVPVESLQQSKAPLALVYQNSTGKDPVLISIISMFAVINGALIQIIMSTRILYGMSSQKWLPKLFSKVNKHTHTPLVATMLVVSLLLVTALLLPLVTLAKTTSFLLLIVFGLVNLALIFLKRRRLYAPNIRTYPVLIPVFGVIFSFGMVIFEVFTG
ncbi:MAG: amino acid permease [Deltaproteobacteria bacterium]|nr:amino acid permease [Deltaproteobacteria bacterium]